MKLETRLLPKPADDKPPLFKLGKRGVLKGYGFVFNQIYSMGTFLERVSPNAVKGCNLDDVSCLFNHDMNKVLGRTTSGTLTVGVDSRGLWYECILPDTPGGLEMSELLKRQDIFQSSFSFILNRKGGDSWTQPPDSLPLRTLESFAKIVDVAPVLWPASPSTTAYLSRGAVEDHDDDRIFASQSLIMAREKTPFLQSDENATTTWTPTVFPDSEFERMERIIARDAEVELLKMKADRATNAHIDIILARMEAVMDADTVRMANQNKQFTTKRF
jgi:HK97 family phage prohead protease